jgi:hypothetical protein
VVAVVSADTRLTEHKIGVGQLPQRPKIDLRSLELFDRVRAGGLVSVGSGVAALLPS